MAGLRIIKLQLSVDVIFNVFVPDQKRESERKMQQRERVLMEREERMQREWQRVQAMRPSSNAGVNNPSGNTPLPRPGSFSSPSPLPFPNMGMSFFFFWYTGQYLTECCRTDPGFLTAEESRNLLNAMKAYESEKDVSVANVIGPC